MADTLHTDHNGVSWLVITSGGKFFGSPDPASQRQYLPMPPDTDVVSSRVAAVAAIEKYATDHAGELTLVVTSSGDRGMGAIVLLVLLALALAADKRR